MLSRQYNVFDNLLEGVQVIDRDFRYIYVNSAVAGQGKFSIAELLGSKMPDKYPGIEKTELFLRIQECMIMGTAGKMLNEFSFPDGSKGFFELRFQQVPEGVLILSVDITELKAISILAEAFYAGMLPHAKEGIVGAVASMHVAASIPNFVAHELPGLQAAPKDKIERSYLGKSYIKKPLVMDEGHIIIKKNFGGPGLGIELDDNLVENERGVPEWEFPEMWDSIDGSVLDH